MKRIGWAALCAAGFLASAGAANAVAVVEYDGGAPHLTNPTNQMGFEGLPQGTFSANTAYVEDGISITYVSASSAANVATGAADTGDRGWEPQGLGDYTDIKMTNGSQMDEVQWQAEGCCETVIYWELLFHGQLVEPIQHFGAVGGPFRNFGLQAFGVTFDEIRLVADSESFNGFDAFGTNQPSALIIDNLAVHSLDPPQAEAVPEPQTWALMIAGFGLAGSTLRRRRLAA